MLVGLLLPYLFLVIFVYVRFLGRYWANVNCFSIIYTAKLQVCYRFRKFSVESEPYIAELATHCIL